MKRLLYPLMLIALCCCNKKGNDIVVLFENNSDVDSIINIETYIDDDFYKSVQVKRDTTRVRYEELLIKPPTEKKNVKLLFVIGKSKDTASCIVYKPVLNKKSYVHVNFNELLFKKGFNYLGQMLQKDSIVRKNFYCEIID